MKLTDLRGPATNFWICGTQKTPIRHITGNNCLKSEIRITINELSYINHLKPVLPEKGRKEKPEFSKIILIYKTLTLIVNKSEIRIMINELSYINHLKSVLREKLEFS